MSLLKKLGMSLASFGLAFALNLESRLYAKDIHVPSEYATTIQTAIDANDTKEGERILVAPGVYYVNEPITYRGKNIILKSEEGAENTIIHMSEPLSPGRSSVFVFENGETNDATLDGFTISGGGGSPAGGDAGISGGGILCKVASPTIRNNIIIKNGVGAFSPYGGQYGEGGGIYCVDSNAQIVDNIITKNKSHRGGGIMCFKSNIIIIDNKIFENSTDPDYGGGIGCQDAECIIKDNLILRNTTNDEGCGGGIGIAGGRIIVENNIIYGNGKSYENWFYPRHGGGICIGEGEIKELILKRNIIINNQANITGGGVYIRNWTSPLILNNTFFGNTLDEISKWVDSVDPIIKNCIVLNKTGPPTFYSLISQIELCGQNGNICADPLFVNPNPDPNTLDALIENGNFDGAMKYLRECYSLQPNSPCIDAGDPNYLLDPDRTRADIGAVYFDQDRNKFIRGDANRDGKVNIEDAVTILYYLTGEKIECKDSADVDDNGKIDIDDVYYLFDYLYRDGNQPPSPFPEAGYDLTPDTLTCYVCKNCEDADINNDWRVDFKDYAIFANSWLEEGSRLGDIYEDNLINFKDLKNLADNWLWNYSWPSYDDD